MDHPFCLGDLDDHHGDPAVHGPLCGPHQYLHGTWNSQHQFGLGPGTIRLGGDSTGGRCTGRSPRSSRCAFERRHVVGTGLCFDTLAVDGLGVDVHAGGGECHRFWCGELFGLDRCQCLAHPCSVARLGFGCDQCRGLDGPICLSPDFAALDRDLGLDGRHVVHGLDDTALAALDLALDPWTHPIQSSQCRR